MRRFLNFGDGFPMTVVTLLVCGPVLFGLALLAIEPMRDPAFFRDLLFNPARHPLFLIWFACVFHALLSPGAAFDDEDDEEAGGPRVWTGLARAADMFWAAAIGIILCLMIVVDMDASDTSREDLAAYIALGLTSLSVLLQWRDRRERTGFGQKLPSAE